jgi:hypothetical protein
MATKLDKDVTRETEINGITMKVTLRADNSISMTPKGKKTSVVMAFEELLEMMLKDADKKTNKAFSRPEE